MTTWRQTKVKQYLQNATFLQNKVSNIKKTQTKDSFLTSRLSWKSTSFVQTQTKYSFLSSRVSKKTTSFCSDSDERQLPFVKTQRKYIILLLRLWTSNFWERQTPADGTSTMMMPGDIMSLIILRQSEDLSLKSQN